MNAIDPLRLKELRRRKGVTQERLADKAGLSKQTIYRCENGRTNLRPKHIEAIAKELEVETGVLTGSKPLPAASEPPAPLDSGGIQVSARIDGQIRNAFTLVSMRYGVRVSQLIALAPLLFTLEAERSLDRRRSNLRDARANLEQYRGAALKFKYLSGDVFPWNAKDDFEAEEQSVSARDIFGKTIPRSMFQLFGPVGGDQYDGNPLTEHLKEEVKGRENAVSIGTVDQYSSDYVVCREEALELSGGDALLAESILTGDVLLYEMPRNLLMSSAVKERTEWLQKEVDKVRAARAEVTDEMFRDFSVELVESFLQKDDEI